MCIRDRGYLSGQDPIMEHADITMETAEIHSMSMEFFTDPWMKEFFGDRETVSYTHLDVYKRQAQKACAEMR